MQADVFGVVYLLLGLAWLGIGVLLWIKRRAVAPASPVMRKLSRAAVYFALALMLEMICSAAVYLSGIGLLPPRLVLEPLSTHMDLWPKGLLLVASGYLFWRIMCGDLETLVLAADIKPQLLQMNMALAEARETLELQYRQLAYHNARLRDLNDAFEQVGLLVSVEQVSATAAERLVSHFGADSAFVWDVRLDGTCRWCAHREGCPGPEQGCLHLAGSAGHTHGAPDRLARLPIGPHVVGPLVDPETGAQPLPLDRIPAVLKGPWLDEASDPLMIAFPLRLGGEQVGAMALFCRGQPAEPNLALLQSLARFTAAALGNARRYERMEDVVRQRTRTLEARNRQLRLQSAELRQAYRHKSEFLSVMSHELRTPLTSIIGFANLITDHMGDSLTGRQRDALRRIERNGQDLLYLISQILDYSKIEAGKMSISPQPVAVGELLRDVLARFEPEAAARQLTLKLEISNAPDSVETDGHRLRQILNNLLGNAVKFTAKGSVALRSDVHDGYLELSVTDTGSGIPVRQLPAVFEEFRQMDSSITRQAGGTGLGLAISRRLVRLLGGELRVSSRPGQGSCFAAMLPLSASDEDPSALATPDALSDGASVLIVDDHEKAAQRVAAHLDAAGFEPMMAFSAGEALELAEGHMPAIIIAELMLPDMAGWDFVARVRSHPHLQHVPVVLVGIVDHPGMEELCGAVAYVLKPVDLSRLGACLAELMPTAVARQTQGRPPAQGCEQPGPMRTTGG